MTETNVIQGYTRQETANICGVNPSRLSYLDRNDLVVPQKIGNPKKPVCIYTWTQLLELKAIFKMREDISLQSIRQLVMFLETNSQTGLLSDKEIIICGDDVYWHSEENSERVLIQIKSKIKNFSPGQYAIMELIIIPNIATLKGEIIDMVKSSEKLKKQGILERIPA